MKNFGTVIDNFDAVTKQYVDNKVPTDEHIKGIKVDNATSADTAKKVQNAFTYKAHNKAAGTVVPITYDGSEAASLDFSADDFAYDYSSGKDIKVKLVDKGYATSVKVNSNTIESSGGVVDIGTVLTDESKFATSAQGTKADNAMPKAGGAFTGAVTVQAPTAEMSPATKQYVDTAINAVKQFEYQVVTELPTAAQATMGKIYLVAHSHNPSDGKPDSYDEFITVKSGSTYKWERIGNTDIDLSGYVPTTRKINNKALSSDITLYPTDVGVTEANFPGLNKTGTITGITMNGESKGTSDVVDLGTVLTDESKFATAAQGSNADSALAKANANATEISNIKNGTNGTKVKYAEHADAADSATSAGTADKVANGLTIANATFDGSKPLTIGTSGEHIEIMGGSAASPNRVSIGLKYGNLMPSSYNKVTIDGYGIVVDGENVDYLTSQSIKKLNTNNTAAQDANESEAIAGSGTINLHKIAKTGSYKDLLNTPSNATQSIAGLMSASDKTKLDGIATGAKGTITGINMNGESKGTSDVVDLGTVLTDASKFATSAQGTKADNALSLDGGTIKKSKTIKMDASANSDGANLKWGTVNSKNPYIGYASDQSDGTFVVGSLLGTNYASGLAIGGGSGNLLWKGTKVATINDIPTNYVKYTEQTLTDAQKSQARSNIGAGTSNFSGNYNDLSNKPTIPTFTLSGTTLTITTN